MNLDEGFSIYNETIHKFTWKGRLLILFGKPLKQSLNIVVDKEVKVLSTTSTGYIPDLFPKKATGKIESEFNISGYDNTRDTSL